MRSRRVVSLVLGLGVVGVALSTVLLLRQTPPPHRAHLDNPHPVAPEPRLPRHGSPGEGAEAGVSCGAVATAACQALDPAMGRAPVGRDGPLASLRFPDTPDGAAACGLALCSVLAAGEQGEGPCGSLPPQAVDPVVGPLLDAVPAEPTLTSVRRIALQAPADAKQIAELVRSRLTPVVVTGLGGALGQVRSRWTPARLRAAFANQLLEFQLKASCGGLGGAAVDKVEATADEYFSEHLGDWKLDQVHVRSADPDSEVVGVLGEDLAPLFGAAAAAGLALPNVDVHMGPEGSCHLPLHTDATDPNFACQISGDKTWYIWPPSAAPILLAEAEAEDPDTARLGDCSIAAVSPAMLSSTLDPAHGQSASMSETTPHLPHKLNLSAALGSRTVVRVHQGECLALPPFWWHTTVYHAPEDPKQSPTSLSIGISGPGFAAV